MPVQIASGWPLAQESALAEFKEDPAFDRPLEPASFAASAALAAEAAREDCFRSSDVESVTIAADWRATIRARIYQASWKDMSDRRNQTLLGYKPLSQTYADGTGDHG